MTCDRIWRKCFFKHIDIPKRWRTDDADSVKPSVQDVFWIECSVEEVNTIILPCIRDDIHKMIVEDTVKTADDDRKFNFMTTRWGTYVQYYPLMLFNEPGSAWEKIGPVEFKDFHDFEKVYPKSTEVKSVIKTPIRTFKVSGKINEKANLSFDCLP